MRARTGLRLSLVAMLATAALVVTTAGPASALCASPTAPAADGRIREVPGGEFIGNGIYSLVGGDQTAFAPPVAGQKFTFEVKFKNRSDKARGVFIQAQLENGSNDSQFRTRAFVGGNEVSGVFDGGEPFKFSGVLPGHSTPTLTVTVKVRRAAPSSSQLGYFVHGAYRNLSVQCGDAPAVVLEPPL